MIEIRRAVPADKARVAEISGRIWEGDDYVARLFDRWVNDQSGYFAVAAKDRLIVGLGKLTMLTEQDAWLEGLRVDPDCRGQGVAKQLTAFFLEQARERSARSLRLSSYLENHESLHIVEKYGFQRIAACKLYELSAQAALPQAAELLRLTDAREIVACLDQATLRQRGGFLAFDFTFEQLTDRLVDELVQTGAWYGLRRADRLVGLLALSDRHAKDDGLSISYLQGAEHYAQLIAYAVNRAVSEQRKLYCMAPADPALQAALRAGGFTSHNGHSQPDVFIYAHAGTLAADRGDERP